MSSHRLMRSKGRRSRSGLRRFSGMRSRERAGNEFMQNLHEVEKIPYYTRERKGKPRGVTTLVWRQKIALCSCAACYRSESTPRARRAICERSRAQRLRPSGADNLGHPSGARLIPATLSGPEIDPAPWPEIACQPRTRHPGAKNGSRSRGLGSWDAVNGSPRPSRGDCAHGLRGVLS